MTQSDTQMIYLQRDTHHGIGSRHATGDMMYETSILEILDLY